MAMTYHERELSDGAERVRPCRIAARAIRRAPWRVAGPVRWTLVVGLILLPAPLHAQLVSDISLSFASVPGSLPLSGAGTNSATLNFGNVSAFEPLTAGVSRTVGASSYTVSTNFGVRTTKNLVGLLSANYTLKGRLQSAQTLTWRVNGTTMSTTDAVIGTSQPYGTAVSHTLSFVVLFSQAAGPVTTVLEITAIAN
jgi:hypothetical protein